MIRRLLWPVVAFTLLWWVFIAMVLIRSDANAAPMWRDPTEHGIGSGSYWVRFPDLLPHRGCWVHVDRTYLLFRCSDGWKARA